MKFFHLSDLHLGNRVNDFSMLEDQKFILDQVLSHAETQKPDAVLIAGDVFDKGVAPVEAITLFDEFVSSLAELSVPVLIISGNHDSADRLAQGWRLVKKSGVYLSPVYRGEVEKVVLQDSEGEVNFYLLPFIKPSSVRPFFPDETIENYTDALRLVIAQMKIDTTKRNVLLCHQFVTGGGLFDTERCDSEEISVGGLDNVDVSVFKDFDYVALGHIHGPQKVGREEVRYSGTPLAYSFSEVHHKKSIVLVTLGKKGQIDISTIPFEPLHRLREIKGSYEEVTLKKNYEGTATDDYLHITLTDEDDVLDALGKLRAIYPNLMLLDYDNKRTRTMGSIETIKSVEEIRPLELFETFFEMQNNQSLTESQKDFLKSEIEKVWESV